MAGSVSSWVPWGNKDGERVDKDSHVSEWREAEHRSILVHTKIQRFASGSKPTGVQKKAYFKFLMNCMAPSLFRRVVAFIRIIKFIIAWF